MGWLARVYVTPKTGVLDPQGKAVQHSLHALGYPEVEDVRIGKYLELRLVDVSRESAEVRLQKMCEQLLANRVIEDYRFEIDAIGTS
ncbi:MAG: phosphoribosylformylglycinamidine synthase [Polyangiaceae bacterium UTPRO1]|jgi:phosphoribosylformylglycinamidine synthase|nr:phosphoribosylformylglycinamidine synthase subunit PurS [Myxococcales bacterium]OQY64665.1 MAG: phosphoribosylformylglycinamidine synthase [Polyangiaceae bacterium UTPRO1]